MRSISGFKQLTALTLLVSVQILLNTALADSLYVKSEKAKILTEPTFKGALVLEVTRGTELELLSVQKSWNQINFNNQTGWISSLLVSATPPIDKITHIGADDSAVTGEVRRRASAVATAGATRGLVASEESGTMTSDYAELAIMELLTVTEADVDRFIESLQQ